MKSDETAEYVLGLRALASALFLFLLPSYLPRMGSWLPYSSGPWDLGPRTAITATLLPPGSTGMGYIHPTASWAAGG